MDLTEAEDIKKKVILLTIILFKNFRIVYNKPIFSGKCYIKNTQHRFPWWPSG